MTDDSPLPPNTTSIVASMDASSRLVWGMLTAAVLCIAAIAALPGLFFGDTGYFHDLFVTLDIIYRTHAGQHSSLDYFGPIGPFVEWIYRLALLLAPPTARILNLGNALIALLALGLSWITLRRRADPTVMALVALTVVTVSLTGLNPDRPLPLFQVSHLAPYNYWGWALFCPVALRTMLPAGKTSDWPGTIACALALAAVFLLKMNYAVGGVGLVAAAMVLRTMSWREGAAILAGMALTILVADLASHGQLRAYLGDLREVSRMPESGLRIGRLIGATLTGLLPIGAFSLALLIGLAREEGDVPSMLRRYRPAMLAAGILGAAAIVVSMQDHDNQGIVLLAFMPLVVIEWLRELSPGRENWGQIWRRRPEWLVAALLVVLPLPTESQIATIREVAVLSTQASDPRFNGTPYAGLTTVFPAVRTTNESSVAEIQYWKMVDGWQLLRANGIGRDARVLALAFSNPFPALLNAPPLLNAPSWLHDGRVFSAEHHLPPEALFSGVDCVMQGRGDDNAIALMQIYGPFLRARYQRRAMSDEWILWVRK